MCSGAIFCSQVTGAYNNPVRSLQLLCPLHRCKEAKGHSQGHLAGKRQSHCPDSGFQIILMDDASRAVTILMGPEEASATEQEVDQASSMPRPPFVFWDLSEIQGQESWNIWKSGLGRPRER